VVVSPGFGRLRALSGPGSSHGSHMRIHWQVAAAEALATSSSSQQPEAKTPKGAAADAVRSQGAATGCGRTLTPTLHLVAGARNCDLASMLSTHFDSKV